MSELEKALVVLSLLIVCSVGVAYVLNFLRLVLSLLNDRIALAISDARDEGWCKCEDRVLARAAKKGYDTMKIWNDLIK
jgi:hypothetical protein